ncbi:MAG: 1-acyl-sn-glycerol-3-phosphate acyltransferase [Acidobacteria bacterium]|nr:1-acyl-sn-glycerol-3-phosphate acyltransferase [Acidobacteriota bacterium]
MTAYAIAAGVVVVFAIVAATLLNRHARELVRTRKLRINRYKMRRKHSEIRLDVFGSPRVVDAVKKYAHDHKVSLDAAERQARIYLFEIMPKFNLLAYYRFGGPIARAFLYLFYWVVVDREHIERLNREIEPDAVVVYMINHRSNVDYVLVAHMLFKFISLSYAVGEWARVWPLNHLFKWFGGYFIRRRFREPLYHAVLSQFVATITRSGVTQGVFLEGGLSRDGAFQKPKLGMLDYLVLAKRDARFTAPLYFVPTAVSYDRVLEDRNLSEELVGVEDRRSRWEKLSSSVDYLFFSLWRSFRGRFKRYGYAMVSFGRPVRLDDFVSAHPDVLAESFESRKPHLTELARTIMEKISDAYPLTPVAIAAWVFAQHEKGAWIEEETLTREIEQARTSQFTGRVWIARESTGAEIWDGARLVLELRHLVEREESRWRWSQRELTLLEYYSNSAMPFADVESRGWKARSVAAE